MTLSNSTELNSTLQHRADYIPLEDLLTETSLNDNLFNRVITELTNKSLRTIVGPRGCGKTHMMRFAWLKCSTTQSLPFSVYCSFNRYFRLEPLLSSNAGAIHEFHSWVLSRILLATKDSCAMWSPSIADADEIFSLNGISNQLLKEFVHKIERGQPLGDELNTFSANLNIELIQRIIDQIRLKAGRRYTVLLMDDAALTLTPDYLIEFLNILRSLKSITIVPKASVYPGTTEVSPMFHEGQDNISIPVWISVEDEDYDSIMHDIALKRVKGIESIPDDVQSILRFASFGIPRAYLTMIDEYLRNTSNTAQQKNINTVITDLYEARLSEYRSLGKKIPKFELLINSGEKVLNGIVNEVKEFNKYLVSKQEKELTYGARADELSPMIERMFDLLVEAGLIYKAGDVKHGTPERIYKRLIPHTALLLNKRAINSGGQGGTVKQTLEAIKFKTTKHPIRKSLARIVQEVDFSQLSYSLPRCANCNTQRVTDNQKFCHNCAHQLIDASTFNQCLDTEISEVPGLTNWQKSQIANNLPRLKTIRDFLAKQDPAADLFSVRGFGQKRTAKIIDLLNSFVDDYLS